MESATTVESLDIWPEIVENPVVPVTLSKIGIAKIVMEIVIEMVMHVIREEMTGEETTDALPLVMVPVMTPEETREEEKMKIVEMLETRE
jgi:hypothetical protein